MKTEARPCLDCGMMYAPRGPRQQRCQGCAVEHARRKNCAHQRAFRARHRTLEETARIERRAWQLDGAKYRAESLFADGMSPSAIALQLRVSHHTLLRHLAQPEARWRVGILRRTDMPELPC
jgi:DNA invertase Pin-like site-specific DNA recombinase